MQGSGPPQAVDVDDLAGDVNETVARDLLHDEVHGEQRGEVVGTGRLKGAGVQRRRRWCGKIGDEVVPGRRHLVV